MNNNLENKINLLYDFNYSKSFTSKFSIDKIKLNDVSIDDIKFIKNEKKNDSYQGLLDEVFDGKFKLVHFNEDTHTTILKRMSDTFSISLYITPYKGNDTINDMNNTNNNDALFSYILSPLVLNKKTKHILLPVINIDTDFQQLTGVLNNYEDIYEEYMKGIDYEDISNVFSVRLKEHFFKGDILSNYFTKKSCSLKSLLFQVIHTLAVLQKNFKGFRHNMLSPENIMVYEKENKIEKYDVNGKTFYVPNGGIEIKITNFHNSIIPGYYSIESDIPFSDNTKRNDYFDLHYFLNRLVHNDNVNTECDDDTTKFLNTVIPQKYRGSSNDYYLSKFVEHVTPKELLDSEYFEEYTKPQSMEYQMSENDYFMGKINITMESDNESILGKQSKNNYYTGKRIISNKKHKQNKILRKFDMSGGGYFKMPETQTKNSPFVSNEQRERYKMKKQEEAAEKEKKEMRAKTPEVVEEERTVTNPFYKPKFTPKQKKTYEKDYVKQPEKMFIPQARTHSPTESEMRMMERPKKNITEAKTFTEKRMMRQPMPPGHKHPQYNHPTYIKTDTNEMYPPPFVQDYDSFPWPHSIPLKKVNEVPLQKIYNINLGNGDHAVLNALYEDLLPGSPYAYSMIKLFERDEIRKFIRNSVLSGQNDGEHLSLQSATKKSILSYFRTLHFNPYGTAPTVGSVMPNPYDLPKNFLIYNLAYPVRYEDDRINPAKKSMGFNLRVYGLTKLEKHFLQFGTDPTDPAGYLPILNKLHFDSYREIFYYEYVRNNIIMKKKSPNFISMVFYGEDHDAKINYDTLGALTGSDNIVLQNNKYLFNKAISAAGGSVNEQQLKEFFNLADTADLTATNGVDHSDVSLLVVTEAPNYNIHEWANPMYNKFSARNEMVSTGVHTIDEWRSVLFQTLYACYVMEKESINFTELSWDNVFVKDLFTNRNSVNHWKYCIGNFEFYVPNYGYLVLIDSRYSDNNVNNNMFTLPVAALSGLVPAPTTTGVQYKITGDIFGTNKGDERAVTPIKDKVMNMFTGGVFAIAPAEIDTLIATINTQLNTKDLKTVIIDNFADLMHNRLGTSLTMNERNDLSITNFNNMKPGSLVVYQERFEDFKWAIYKGQHTTPGQHNIIVRDPSDKPIEKQVFIHSLQTYPRVQDVLPSNTPTMRFDTDSLIETYRI